MGESATAVGRTLAGDYEVVAFGQPGPVAFHIGLCKKTRADFARAESSLERIDLSHYLFLAPTSTLDRTDLVRP